MQSRNPVLSKAPAFQPSPYAPAYDQPGTGPLVLDQPYGSQPYAPPQPYATTGTMTLDDVLTKTAVTLGLLIVAAAVSFWGLQRLTVDPASPFSMPNLGVPFAVMTVSGLVAFGAVFLVSFRRAVNPAFVLAYAVIEGVFIGALSLIFELYYPGIVLPAAFGTFVAAGVTLAAYKLLRIRVSSKFRRMVAIGTMALAGVYLVNFILSLFGVRLGIVTVTGAVGPLALLMSAIGVGLAVFNLILDFDYIEQGVRAGAPASESWRAAFGLAVTMVWLYTELLRILSYFSRD